MAVCVGSFCDGTEQNAPSGTNPAAISIVGQRLADQLGPICLTSFQQMQGAFITSGAQQAREDDKKTLLAGPVLIQLLQLLRSLGSGAQRNRKTAAQGQGAGLTVCTELSLALGANKIYGFEFDLTYRTTTTAMGMSMDVAFTGTASEVRYSCRHNTTPANQLAVQQATNINVVVGNTGAAAGPGLVDTPTAIRGTIVTTGAGVLALRFQATGTSPNASIQIGSTSAAFEV